MDYGRSCHVAVCWHVRSHSGNLEPFWYLRNMTQQMTYYIVFLINGGATLAAGQVTYWMLYPDSKVHGATHGAHLGLAGPRWAQCGPHELCYLGNHTSHTLFYIYLIIVQKWAVPMQLHSDINQMENVIYIPLPHHLPTNINEMPSLHAYPSLWIMVVAVMLQSVGMYGLILAA